VDCTVQASLQSPFFCLGDWPQEDWWLIFDSPQLTDLISEALCHNPTLQEVRAAVRLAKQEAVIARSQLFPYIFFDADFSRTYLSQNGLYRALNPNVPLNANLIDISFSLQYEFDFWGKNRNIFLAALGEAWANQAEAAQVRLMVTTSIGQAYFALKADLLRRDLYEALLCVNETILELLRLMESKALASRLDPLLAVEAVYETKQLIANIDQEILVGKHLLNYLVGRGPDVPICVDHRLPCLPPKIAIPDHLTLDLLARRPDLMAQIWRAKAIANEVGAAIADFYPNISISALIGLESVFYSKIFEAHSVTYNATPAIHLPIFTAGAIQANVDAHRAAFDAAIYAYNDLVLQSAQEVADLLVLAQSIFEQKAEQDRVVSASQERVSLITMRKKSGLNSRFDELAIQTELINKKLQNVSLLYGQYAATIKLIKALGGGYRAPCIPLQSDGGCS
jgi:NodT family efflux transporter outer membrane factor (OMF) lipoprotein